MRKTLLLLAIIFTCFLLLFAGPVLAQEDDNGYPPDVEGITEEVDDDAAGEGLPFTGANLTLFAFAGVIAIGTGAFIVVRARRSESDEVPSA
ncbi:MAG: hypothetical protein GEU68_10110 [Actinobacteria bacterium]|nr:hypothetical protein [Actinomycetota bacterium]